MQHFTHWFFAACVAVATHTPAGAQDAVPPPAARVPAGQVRGADPAATSRVIRDLIREARAAWKRQGRWPREKSSYAAEKQMTLPNEQLVTVLGRRLGHDPALEAYIKWQLMSFAPDFTGATLEQYRRILRLMPEPVAQPKPAPPPKPASGGASINITTQVAFVSDLVPIPGTNLQRPVLSVVNSGTGLGVGEEPDPYEPVRALETMARRLDEARQKTAQANVPILAYRDTLIREIPDDERGVRVQLLMQDLVDRVQAGDPSYPTAVDRMVRATERVRDGRPLLPAVRALLLRRLASLAKIRTTVIHRIDIGPGGRVHDDREEVYVDPRTIRIMIENVKAGR